MHPRFHFTLCIALLAVSAARATEMTEAALPPVVATSWSAPESSAAIAKFAHAGFVNAESLAHDFALGRSPSVDLLLEQIPAASDAPFSARQVFGSGAPVNRIFTIWIARHIELAQDARRMSSVWLKLEFRPPACPTTESLAAAMMTQPKFSGVFDVSDTVSFKFRADDGALVDVSMPIGSCIVEVSRHTAMP
jgi:hypothetical protein